MERDRIPYVTKSIYTPPYPVVPLQDMTLEEIKKKYLSNCGKANGNPAVCSKCSSPCAEGKRAIQLLSNQVYNDPPIPLYGGKTLIEKAREENMARRQKMQEQSEIKRTKDNRIYIIGWYEKAVASGDAVKWVMETYNMSKDKAKAKIAKWRSMHKEEVKKDIKEESVPANAVEEKLESLMKLQEKHKKIMQEYQEQYEKAKQNYEAISKKIDILCNAMDIMNE